MKEDFKKYITRKLIVQFFSLFFITRFADVAACYIGRIYFHVPKGQWWHFSKYIFMDCWAAWDSGWYMNVALNGYSTIGEPPNYGFFPLFPYLVRGVAFFTTHHLLVGLILNNIFFIVGCGVLYFLVVEKWNELIAKRTILMLLIYPYSFYYSCFLTEPMFFMLCVLSFYFLQKDKLQWFGLTGLLSTLLRPTGILNAVPLFVEYLTTHYKNIKLKHLIWFSFFPIGIFSFYFYLYHLTGDFSAYPHLKAKVWGNQFTEPFTTLWRSLTFQNHDVRFIYHAYLVVFYSGLFINSFKKIPLSYWVFGMFNIWFSLLNGDGVLICITRHITCYFPFFILLAMLNWNKKLAYFFIPICIGLQAVSFLFWGSELFYME